MSNIVDRLRSEYSGKDVCVDTLIDRYDVIERDVRAWREAIDMDGLTHTMSTGFMLSHPLIKNLIAMERLLHVTLRELMFAVRLVDWKKDAIDDVDTFLAQMQQGTKPHFNRITGQ